MEPKCKYNRFTQNKAANKSKTTNNADVCYSRNTNARAPFVKLYVSSLNPCSVKNKTGSLCDYITDHDFDVLALCETWLGTISDKKCIADLVLNGYSIKSVPRKTVSVGGGVALIYRSSLKVKLVKQTSFSAVSHFEYAVFMTEHNKSNFTCIVIYRPPPSKRNKFKNSVFHEEWALFLSEIIVKYNEILVVGDMNFHLDNKHDLDTKHFISCLQSFGLRQHVNTATHKHGHTLDVVITRDSSNLVSDLTVSDPHLCNDGGKITRDHLAVNFKLNITKPARVRKLVGYRKLRCVNVESFKRDIKSSVELNQSHKSIDSLVHSSIHIYYDYVRNTPL